MYGYYFWSTLEKWDKGDDEEGKAAGGEKAKVKLTWTQSGFYRPYITSSQMLQFVCMLLQATHNVYFDVPNFPRFCSWILFYYMFTMLGLFGNFFVKQYCTKKPRVPKGMCARSNAA